MTSYLVVVIQFSSLLHLTLTPLKPSSHDLCRQILLPRRLWLLTIPAPFLPFPNLHKLPILLLPSILCLLLPLFAPITVLAVLQGAPKYCTEKMVSQCLTDGTFENKCQIVPPKIIVPNSAHIVPKVEMVKCPLYLPESNSATLCTPRNNGVPHSNSALFSALK